MDALTATPSGDLHDSFAARPLRRARRGIERHGTAAFLKEAALRPLRPALAPIAAQRLRNAAARANGLDAKLDLAYDFDAFGITIRPGQVRREIRELLTLLQAEPPRRVLEIGTANGGSLFLWTHFGGPEVRVISVDLPHGAFGGGYPAWKVPVYKAFTRPGQSIRLVRGDSHRPETVAQVERLLDGDQLDFLFIDGDHSADGVRRDFETYSRLVRPGGLVGLHDIAPPRPDVAPREDGVEYLVGDVPAFWAELRATHPEAREIVDPDGPGCFGIGLIGV
jgi:predicted O-methyltransferase YrrM